MTETDFSRGLAAITDSLNGVFHLLQEDHGEALDDLTSEVISTVLGLVENDVTEAVLKKEDPFISVTIADICAADIKLSTGMTPVENYLELKGGTLHPMAVKYLEGWRDSSLSLLQVQEYSGEDFMTVSDLLSRRKYHVYETTFSEILRVGSSFISRVVPVGEIHMLSPAFLPVPKGSGELFAEDFRKDKEDFSGSRTLSWKKFFKKHYEYLPVYWLEDRLISADRYGVLTEEEIPEFTDHNGDPLDYIRITFNLTPGSVFAVRSMLQVLPGMAKTGPSEFLLHYGSHRRDTLMAQLRLSEVSLSADVCSVKRADSIERYFLDEIGKHITGMIRESLPVEQWDIHDILADMDPAEKTVFISGYMKMKYRKWLDTENPDLDGKTPREAALSIYYRKALTDILQEIEAEPLPEGIPHNTDWLWKEIGMERPED